MKQFITRIFQVRQFLTRHFTGPKKKPDQTSGYGGNYYLQEARRRTLEELELETFVLLVAFAARQACNQSGGGR